MAFGKHWEWRGFGRISDELRARIESLAPLFASDRSLIDTYLWTPHSPVNVKLRLGDLKFKHLIESDGDLECWLEDANDIHPFPLTAGVVSELERALSIRLVGQQQTLVGRSELAALLQNAQPPARILLVEKHRRLFSLPTSSGVPAIVTVHPPPTSPRNLGEAKLPPAGGGTEGGGGERSPAIVELTDLVRPEHITTIALEHPDIEIIKQALGQLGLPNSGLHPRNYLQALSVWAAGERILRD